MPKLPFSFFAKKNWTNYIEMSLIPYKKTSKNFAISYFEPGNITQIDKLISQFPEYPNMTSHSLSLIIKTMDSKDPARKHLMIKLIKCMTSYPELCTRLLPFIVDLLNQIDINLHRHTDNLLQEREYKKNIGIPHDQNKDVLQSVINKLFCKEDDAINLNQWEKKFTYPTSYPFITIENAATIIFIYQKISQFFCINNKERNHIFLYKYLTDKYLHPLELCILFDALKGLTAINTHRNLDLDQCLGINITKSWRQTWWCIRENALENLFEWVDSVELKNRLNVLNWAEKQSIFSDHIENFIIFGGWGRTPAIRAIQAKRNEVEKMLLHQRKAQACEPTARNPISPKNLPGDAPMARTNNSPCPLNISRRFN